MLSLLSPRSIFQWTNQQCQLCHLPLRPRDQVWCQHCINHFPQPPYCSRCGMTTAKPSGECGNCLLEPPPWQQFYRLGEYNFPLRQLVHQLKFSGKFWLAEPLGAPSRSANCPSGTCRHSGPPCIRYVGSPVVSTKVPYWPGAIARETESRCLPNALQRTRHTQTQRHLSKRDRKKNLNQAFILKAKQLPEHVAIVDDVVTTGSTVAELTHLLLRNGVKQVDIYCICFTPPRQ